MIALARVLPGSVPFKNGNVSDTFRGQILISDDQKSSAIIKDLPPKELANEIIAAALAEALGLPAPKAFLAVATDADFIGRKGPSLGHGERLVFASSELAAKTVSYRFYTMHDTSIIEKLGNWPYLGGLYAFDSWLANVDRHEGNLLLDESDNVFLIDHGYSFTGPNWEPAHLQPDGRYTNKLAGWLTDQLHIDRRVSVTGSLGVYLQKFCALNLQEILDAEFLSDMLSSDELDSVRCFLSSRCNYVHQISCEALRVLI